MSLDPRTRRVLELLLRIAAFALLAWALWTALHPRERRKVNEMIRVSAAAARLPSVTRDARLASLHVDVDSTPDARTLAWLGALRRSGVRVGWSGNVPALAAVLEPVADPRGGVRLAVAAPVGVRAVVRDEAGEVDTLVARGGGASLALPFAAGAPRVAVGPIAAVAGPADSLLLRRVLVVGAAGWEGKFAVAALEERGWRVAARLAVAPRTAVVQDEAPLDTSRFAAAVVLDSSAGSISARIARFVEQGGGLVLAGDAGRTPGLAALAPGVPGARIAARAFLVADSIGPATLGFRPIVGLAPGAVVLARRGRAVSVAAMRVGAGRVIQAGLDESWRWRMEGGDAGVAAHRAWWASLVAAVAYAPPVRRAGARDRAAADAPRARLFDALGAPAAAASEEPGGDGGPPLRIVALALALLLLEWGSRRLRGAP